jgi:hypothetical protein
MEGISTGDSSDSTVLETARLRTGAGRFEGALDEGGRVVFLGFSGFIHAAVTVREMPAVSVAAHY